MTSQPLVLTLKLDLKTFKLFNELRQQYFPRERNFLPAHVTLFHALPGEQSSSIQQTLAVVCSQTESCTLHFPRLRFLGKGVAAAIDSSQLIQLQKQLATGWHAWLSRQDQQGYCPHITIQNKVTAVEAQQLYEQLEREWQPLSGSGEGLLLWYYQGGPWELVREFPFRMLPNQ